MHLLQQQQGEQQQGEQQQQATKAQTAGGATRLCAKTKPVVALLTLAVVAPNADPKRHHMYWLSTATKRLYAQRHGHPLYVQSLGLQTARAPAWEKVVAIRAVMQHSCAEWVWVTDADAFVVGAELSITEFLRDALGEAAAARPGAPPPDVLVGHDCNGLNSGSMLLRNTDWTLQHLADLWFTDGDSLDGIALIWEQAAINHLIKHPEVAPHYHLVKQRRINAYPAASGCHDGSGMYTEGDGLSIIAHVPGGYKVGLSAEHPLFSPMLAPAKVAAALADGARQGAPVYALYPPGAPGGGPASRLEASATRVRVELSRSHVAGPSNSDAKEAAFTLEVAPRSPGTANPGWPVVTPPFLRDVSLAVMAFAKQAAQEAGGGGGGGRLAFAL